MRNRVFVLMFVLTGVSLMVACKGSDDFLGGQQNEDSETQPTTQNLEPTLKQSDRPHEGGEGLPGYTSCNILQQPSEEESSGQIACRLEADGKKINLDPNDVTWALTVPEAIRVSQQTLTASEPWHIQFDLFSSDADLLRRAMYQSQLAVSYQTYKLETEIANTYYERDNFNVSESALMVTFGQASELSPWQNLRPPTQAATEALQVNLNYLNQQIRLELASLASDPAQPIEMFSKEGASFEPDPWQNMSHSALKHLTGFRVTLSGLVPGSYRCLILSADIDPDASSEGITFAADVFESSARQRKSQELAIAELSAAATNFSDFAALDFEVRADNTGSVTIELTHGNASTSNRPLWLQGLILDRY